MEVLRAEFLEPWTQRGVAWATLLHTRSRARADEPSFTRPLEEATGVWFSGGDQSRVTRVYLGTAVERALRGVLDRGGVIEVWPDASGAKARADHFAAQAKENAMMSPEHAYLSGPVLVRISGRVDPGVAAKFGAVVATLGA